MKAKQVLNKIFNDNRTILSNKQCILVDGPWGIGKTHFIQNYFTENEEKYELIYVTVFGKNSIKDIEKAILVNSFPGFKNFDPENGAAKLTKSVMKDIGKKFLGINIDNYINLFSIEDIKWDSISDKRKIVCFDDIERKSEKIEMKDLLGLIERTKRKFDVILIGNFNKVEEKGNGVFNEYKEKIIDDIITIDCLDRSTLKHIVNGIGLKNIDTIIDVFLNDNIAFGEALNDKTFLQDNVNNLRIFIKYIELIMRVKTYLEPYDVDRNAAKVCKAVIYDYYFQDKNNNKVSMNFDIFNIYKTIKKVFLNEDIKKEEFREYFVANSEIRKDIASINNAYMLNEDEFKKLKAKVFEKVENKDLKYFLKQSDVISLVSSLNEVIKIDPRINGKLLSIAIELYSPEESQPYIDIDYSDWDYIDESDEEVYCADQTKEFIDEVNQICKKKFNEFINNKYDEAMKIKDYMQIIRLLEVTQIRKIKDFEEIFDYYFNELNVTYSEDVEKIISTLISKVNSELIGVFFQDRIKNEKQLTKIKKYQRFDLELEQKIQQEYAYEYYSENYQEDF
ncbi:P-loop NTPase fold protein [Clostridium sp. C8-1-8]|uniref:P-loop NTPase fold protein n=1 Tax=Clostridium sp. C8-1-8 TaxID=2698831 RepID=UPI001FAC3513|nr:P-loop NTPase fold protein [Clostridium sp. C8-1-8]